MNKVKFYKIASISLLLLNVFLVSAFFITKPKGMHDSRRGTNAQELLKMDEVQHDLFLANVESHHREMEAIMEKKIEILKPFLYSVGNSDQTESQDATIQMMKEFEGQKLVSTYKHLQDVKNILNEDQLPLFDSFLKQRLEDMTVKNEGRRPNEKK